MEHNKKLMKKVEVEWMDAQSSMEQVFLDELSNIKFNMTITKSCGYLIHEDNEKVVLGFMLFGEESIKHWQMIPKSMIKNIRELKPFISEKGKEVFHDLIKKSNNNGGKQ